MCTFSTQVTKSETRAPPSIPVQSPLPIQLIPSSISASVVAPDGNRLPLTRFTVQFRQTRCHWGARPLFPQPGLLYLAAPRRVPEEEGRNGFSRQRRRSVELEDRPHSSILGRRPLLTIIRMSCQRPGSIASICKSSTTTPSA